MNGVAIASLALTVISLALAVWTLIQARNVQQETERLRNRFLFQARVAGFARSMKNFARFINLQIAGKGITSHKQQALLKRCDAQLENFEPKLDQSVQQRASALRTKIENALQGGSVEKAELQAIHGDLHGLVQATEDLLEDREQEVIS